MRLTRPLLLLALAALMAPRAAASRTSVWESNPPAAAVLTTTNAAGLLAPLAPAGSLESIVADVEPVEPLRFDLGDVVLVENPREDGFRIGLADVVEPPALRGPPLLDGDPHQAFELRDPETRIRGLELLPPFRVGASASLSLWGRQACGFSCREVVSDSRYDPWGLAVSATKKGVMIASEELLHSPIEHFSWDWAAEHPDQFYALLTKRGGMNELEAGKLMADNGVMPGGQAGREFFVRQVSRDSSQLADDATELWTSGMLGLGVDRALTAAGRKAVASYAGRRLAPVVNPSLAPAPVTAIVRGIRARLTVSVSRYGFTQDEVAWIRYKYGVAGVRIAAGAERSVAGAKVPYRYSRSQRFLRDTLKPDARISDIKVGEVAPGKNVDEFVSRNVGGRQVAENQNLAPERANKILGALEEAAIKNLPADTPILGWIVDIIP